MSTKDDEQFRHEHSALTEAIRASKLPRRKADEGDHVPATKLPMTKAQWIARDLQHGKR